MTRTISTLLVANRAEIARRIIRSARQLGIKTVAVYSDADASLPHVRDADLAVRVGEAPAERSYLDLAAIVSAAERAGADAVHPGYGFLAENAGFARAVIEAGLIWVGPPPEAIVAMGDKAAARKLAERLDLPTVVGYDGDDQTEAAFLGAAETLGYPLLVKATAGGGGRGMRRVQVAAELPAALESARREAQAAFGDDRLLLERYVEASRHVEIQILCDRAGRGVHVFERECSIQRRHQKLIEEAPSPALDDMLREQMGQAALRLAAEVGYVGAGTVEFLLDEQRRFYFLEMNTRLQVEHPVTELIAGCDLVGLQIAVAEGAPLPMEQGDLCIDGHAIEARIYAEDPSRDYLPATGTLVRFDVADEGGVRVDAGYGAGDVISVHYDSMLAKVIAWGDTRAIALRRLRRALDRAWIPGLTTNLPLLRQVLGEPDFLAGATDTSFLPAHGLPRDPPLNLEKGALAATIYGWKQRRARTYRPDDLCAGWRIEGPAWSSDRWQSLDQQVTVAYRASADGGSLRLRLGEPGSGGEGVAEHVVRNVRLSGDSLRYDLDGMTFSLRVARRHSGDEPLADGEQLFLHFGDAEAVVALVPRFPAPALAEAEPGSCVAPTPGTVVKIHVELGAEVRGGQSLLTLEAMKMEHDVVASEAGVVASIAVDIGDPVDQGQILLRLDTAAGR